MSDTDDATVSMEKTNGVTTIVMRSPTVAITLVANGEETPEHLNDMVMEFPEAVYAVIVKAMGDDDDDPT